MLKSRYENIMFENDDLRKKDYLDNLIYSEDLAEKITEYFNSEKNKPLYIALTGSWGSGKTTVATTAIKMIKDKDKVKVFSYDAWKYEGDSFRRSFTQNILDNSDIKKESAEYKKYINRMYDDKSVETNSIKERINLSKHTDTEYSLLPFLITFGIAFIVCLITSIFFSKTVIIASALVISIFNSIGGFAFFQKFNTDIFNKFLTAKVTYNTAKLFSPEQFYSTVCEILKDVKEKNIIILIDNIDRCNTNEFKQTISSIKGFFNENSKIVYLIPFDVEQFNIVFNNEYQSYSEKIFDYTVDLKEKSQKNIINFVDKLLMDEKDYKDLFTNEAVDIIAKSDCKTPRQIINICNDYITEYNLFILKNKINPTQINKEDLSYLMKYTILKKYHKDLFKTIHINTDIIKNLEQSSLDHNNLAEFRKYYSNLQEETYLFLRKTPSILPSNYDYFYSSHSKDDFDIDEEILDAIQTEQYEIVNNIIKNNEIKKLDFLKYMMKSIMFEKNKSLWKTSIASKMRLIIYLLKENTITIEEVDENFDFLMNDNDYFDNLVFNREIDLMDAIYFINLISLNYSKKYKMKDKLLKGLINKKILTKGDSELDIASIIFGELEINKLNEIYKGYLIAHLDKLINNQSFKVLPHCKLLSSDSSKYITVDQIKKILDYSTGNDNEIFSDIINLVKTVPENSMDNDLVVRFIRYVNKIYSNIKDEITFLNIFKLFYNNKEKSEWINNLSMLSINNISEQYLNYETIDMLIELFEISNNSNIKNILLSLSIDEKYNYIFNKITTKKDINNNLVGIIKDFITRMSSIKFEQKISELSKLYGKLDNTYKNWFNQIITSNHSQLCDQFYKKLILHEDKEAFAEYIVNLNLDFNGKIRKINFFTTSNERFQKILNNQNDLSNLETIFNNVKDQHYRNIVIDKIANVIEGKSSIINNDLEIFVKLIKNENITLQNQKTLLIALGVYKTNPNDLKKIYDSLKLCSTIKKQYLAIESILLEHNLITQNNNIQEDVVNIK